jgi:hypothetical protein
MVSLRCRMTFQSPLARLSKASDVCRWVNLIPDFFLAHLCAPIFHWGDCGLNRELADNRAGIADLGYESNKIDTRVHRSPALVYTRRTPEAAFCVFYAFCGILIYNLLTTLEAERYSTEQLRHRTSSGNFLKGTPSGRDSRPGTCRRCTARCSAPYTSSSSGN